MEVSGQPHVLADSPLVYPLYSYMRLLLDTSLPGVGVAMAYTRKRRVLQGSADAGLCLLTSKLNPGFLRFSIVTYSGTEMWRRSSQCVCSVLSRDFSDCRRVLDWWPDLLDSLIMRVTTLHSSLLHTVSTVKSSLPFVGSDFQRRTFPFLCCCFRALA
jgi:hypothetical protein